MEEQRLEFVSCLDKNIQDTTVEQVLCSSLFQNVWVVLPASALFSGASGFTFVSLNTNKYWIVWHVIVHFPLSNFHLCNRWHYAHEKKKNCHKHAEKRRQRTFCDAALQDTAKRNNPLHILHMTHQDRDTTCNSKHNRKQIKKSSTCEKWDQPKWDKTATTQSFCQAHGKHDTIF